MNKLLLLAGGLAGLYVLTGGGMPGGEGTGGSGGGGGTERPKEESGDTVINIPELDLSNLWGDGGGFTPKKDIMPDTDKSSSYGPWAQSQFESLSKSVRAGNITLVKNPSSPTGYSQDTLSDMKKYQASISGGQGSSSGFRPYITPAPTAASHAALVKKNVITHGYSF